MSEFLPVSLVGSYPLIFDLPTAVEDEETRNFLCSLQHDSVADHLVAYAVAEQLEIVRRDGSHVPVIITSGQPDLSMTRSMVHPYLQLFDGVGMTQVRETTTAWATGSLRLRPGYEGAGVVRDIRIAAKVIDYYRTRYRMKAALKFIVTGPNTLFWGGIQQYPGDDETVESLIQDLADGLIQIVEQVLGDPKLKREIGYVQIDEPIFSSPFFKHVPKQCRHVTGNMAKRITDSHAVRVVLHICGNTSFGELDLYTDKALYALDIELANMLGQGTSCLYTTNYLCDLRRVVRDCAVKLSLGVVNSRHDRIEEVAELQDFISLLVREIGYENVIVSPDCGLRNFAPFVARSKLVNILRATTVVRRSIEVIRRAKYVETVGEYLAGEFTPPAHGVFYPALTDASCRIRTHKLRTAASKLLSRIHGPSGFGDFTMHTELHSLNVLHYMNQFLGAIDPDAEMLRLLFACAYVHDLGMVELFAPDLDFAARRSQHGQIICAVLAKITGDLELSAVESPIVGEACGRHPRHRNLDGLTSRTKLIAALLKIADECDSTHHRLPARQGIEGVKRRAEGGDLEAQESLRMYEEHQKIEAVYVNHVERQIQIVIRDGYDADDPYAVKTRDRIDAQLQDEVRDVLAENRLYIDKVVLVTQGEVARAASSDAMPAGRNANETR